MNASGMRTFIGIKKSNDGGCCPLVFTTSNFDEINWKVWRNMLRRTGRMTPLPKQGVIFPVRLGGSSLGTMIHDLDHWIHHDPPKISTHESRSFFGFSARVVVVFGVCFSWHIWEPEVLGGTGEGARWEEKTFPDTSWRISFDVLSFAWATFRTGPKRWRTDDMN